MEKKVIIGVDIGGTKISAGLLNYKGDILIVKTELTLADQPKDVVLRQIFKVIDDLIQDSKVSIEDIKGIGVCCPGPLNPKTGEIFNPPNLQSLWNINLKNIIFDHFKVPVLVENDANAAGLAEILIGAAKDCNNILYVTVSTGIGTGIIIDRKIYHGKNGFAGEGGHISINIYERVICNCKAAGCIESMASGTAIARLASQLVKLDKATNSMLNSFKSNPENITAKDVANFALNNDTLCVNLIQQSAYCIGAWLGGMINLLDPDMIVVGGGVASIGDMFFNQVREAALLYTYNLNAKNTPIIPAKLQSNVGIYGAASLFL